MNADLKEDRKHKSLQNKALDIPLYEDSKG